MSGLTPRCRTPTIFSMDLQLPEKQTAELVSLASRTGRSANDLVVEAVDRLLSEENWFHTQVQVGIDQIARGEWIEETEMDARVAPVKGYCNVRSG